MKRSEALKKLTIELCNQVGLYMDDAKCAAQVALDTMEELGMMPPRSNKPFLELTGFSNNGVLVKNTITGELITVESDTKLPTNTWEPEDDE